MVGPLSREFKNSKPVPSVVMAWKASASGATKMSLFAHKKSFSLPCDHRGHCALGVTEVLTCHTVIGCVKRTAGSSHFSYADPHTSLELNRIAFHFLTNAMNIYYTDYCLFYTCT